MGSYAGSYQPFYQGLFLAPHVVAQALLGSVIIFNIMAVLILALEHPDAAQHKDELPAQLKKAAKSIATNPLIISILLGGLSALLGFTYPTKCRTARHQVPKMRP